MSCKLAVESSITCRKKKVFNKKLLLCRNKWKSCVVKLVVLITAILKTLCSVIHQLSTRRDQTRLPRSCRRTRWRRTGLRASLPRWCGRTGCCATPGRPGWRKTLWCLRRGEALFSTGVRNAPTESKTMTSPPLTRVGHVLQLPEARRFGDPVDELARLAVLVAGRQLQGGQLLDGVLIQHQAFVHIHRGRKVVLCSTGGH